MRKSKSPSGSPPTVHPWFASAAIAAAEGELWKQGLLQKVVIVLASLTPLLPLPFVIYSEDGSFQNELAIALAAGLVIFAGSLWPLKSTPWWSGGLASTCFIVAAWFGSGWMAALLLNIAVSVVIIFLFHGTVDALLAASRTRVTVATDLKQEATQARDDDGPLLFGMGPPGPTE